MSRSQDMQKLSSLLDNLTLMNRGQGNLVYLIQLLKDAEALNTSTTPSIEPFSDYLRSLFNDGERKLALLKTDALNPALTDAQFRQLVIGLL